MAEQDLNSKTIALIDSLKSTTGAYGLANNGSEYKIITEIFLYKFFNDKFGYEAKRAPEYGERLKKAENGMPNTILLQKMKLKTCLLIFRGQFPD